MSIPPWEMFLNDKDKYSKFDDKGIPLLDNNGEELSKSAKKKLEKLYNQQAELYNNFQKNKQQS
jgi:cysteinyl-tRNA synthetase